MGKYPAIGYSSPRQGFKTDACLPTNPHVFLVKYETFKKDLKSTVHHIYILTPVLEIETAVH